MMHMQLTNDGYLPYTVTLALSDTTWPSLLPTIQR